MDKMDNEVVLDLFIRFLEKRGVKDIDLKKEPAGLIAFGKASGFLRIVEVCL